MAAEWVLKAELERYEALLARNLERGVENESLLQTINQLRAKLGMPKADVAALSTEATVTVLKVAPKPVEPKEPREPAIRLVPQERKPKPEAKKKPAPKRKTDREFAADLAKRQQKPRKPKFDRKPGTYVRTEEHRRKASESRKGRKQSPDVVAKRKHYQWHANRGLVSPDCVFCQSQGAAEAA